MLSQAQEVMQEVSRPLLTPDEVTNMPAAKKGAVGNPPQDGIIEPGKMLVFAPGCPAIYGVQPLYFKEAAFAARAAIPPVKREAAPQ
jgi:type IV secretion system protein VirD4